MKKLALLLLVTAVSTAFTTSLAVAAAKVSQTTRSILLEPDAVYHLAVECPLGTLPVGGSWSGLHWNVRVSGSRFDHPTVGNAWYVVARNLTTRPQTFTYSALCASSLPSGASVFSASASAQVPSYSTIVLNPQCPVGSVATSLGFRTPEYRPDVVAVVLAHLDGRTGYVAIVNRGTTTQAVHGYATCLAAGSNATISEAWVAGTGGSGFYNGEAACPRGTLLTGGGYFASPSDHEPYASFRASNFSWRFSLYTALKPTALHAIAFCATIP